MSDFLDLDAIKPQPKKIKINNQIVECNPLSLEDYLSVVELQPKLTTIKEPSEVLPLLKKGLYAFCPTIFDKKMKLSILQWKEILVFAAKASVPEMEKKQYADPKKKALSQEDSPTSLDSTQDTQQEQP